MTRRLLCLTLVSLMGCEFVPSPVSDVRGAPDGGLGPPPAPDEAAPTGSKWAGVDVEGDCGRIVRRWTLVDEVCGLTDAPDYIEAFHAPLFRDGALVGETLYTVDGSNLWSLDVSDPVAPVRLGVLSGLGDPLAVAHEGNVELVVDAAGHAYAHRDATLAVAAGEAGLVVLDATRPDAPREVGRLPLGAPALAVALHEGIAYVAAGAAGLAVVDLGSEPLRVDRFLSVPGWAAGVAVRDGLAYVAACQTLAIVDLGTGELVGEARIPNDAPARGVTLVEGVAFVAAGRLGAVAIDVANPAEPRVLGNCRVDEPSFYASGVRAQAGVLYVAAGEWGVLPLDVTTPAATCARTNALAEPVAEAAVACTTEPPWEVLPWEETWEAPPPWSIALGPAPEPGRDPLQTLPAGEVLYTFGDARRIGFRAINVHAAADPALARLGRFEEPMLARGVAAVGGRVLVVGPGGGLFDADHAALLVPNPEVVDHVAEGVAGALLDDGRWAVATAEPALHVSGRVKFTLPGVPHARAVVARGSTFGVAVADGVLEADPTTGTHRLIASGRSAMLPATVLATPKGFVLAAPEWSNTLMLDGEQVTELPPHGVFDETSVLDPRAWQEGLPRRLLGMGPKGPVEVVSLGLRAKVVAHGAAGGELSLPEGTYVDLVVGKTRMWLLAADRSRYRSELLTVRLNQGAPKLVAVESFAGVGTGAARSGNRLYVTEGRGVRVYDLAAAEAPTLLGVVELAGSAP
jgi:hypothetical protein